MDAGTRRADVAADPARLALVRLLLFLALAAIAVAIILYTFTRDRRYLRFIWQTMKLTVLILAIVLIYFASERLIGPMLPI